MKIHSLRANSDEVLVRVLKHLSKIPAGTLTVHVGSYVHDCFCDGHKLLLARGSVSSEFIKYWVAWYDNMHQPEQPIEIIRGFGERPLSPKSGSGWPQNWSLRGEAHSVNDAVRLVLEYIG